MSQVDKPNDLSVTADAPSSAEAKYIRVREAARILGVSEKTIYRWAACRKLRTFDVPKGHAVLIDRASLVGGAPAAAIAGSIHTQNLAMRTELPQRRGRKPRFSL